MDVSAGAVKQLLVVPGVEHALDGHASALSSNNTRVTIKVLAHY